MRHFELAVPEGPLTRNPPEARTLHIPGPACLNSKTVPNPTRSQETTAGVTCAEPVLITDDEAAEVKEEPASEHLNALLSELSNPLAPYDIAPGFWVGSMECLAVTKRLRALLSRPKNKKQSKGWASGSSFLLSLQGNPLRRQRFRPDCGLPQQGPMACSDTRR